MEELDNLPAQKHAKLDEKSQSKSKSKPKSQSKSKSKAINTDKSYIDELVDKEFLKKYFDKKIDIK
tara:strand:+ start:45 stop:242 length:198 start_codon:yes stop_codon:yes gene_type:complete